MNKKLIISILISGIFIIGCSNEGNKQNEILNEDSLATAQPVINKNNNYKVPSPVELYFFLYEQKAKFRSDLLNRIENYSKYSTETSKALNLGIYSSDLAYCTVFGQNQFTVKYFTTAKRMADELKLTEGFGQAMADRISSNLENSDSLYQITTDSYWDACTHLEAMGQTNILSLVLIGGWVESVYIAFNSVDKFNPDHPIVIRITEQQFLLENLLGYLGSIEKTEQTNAFIEKLTELQHIFEGLIENPDGKITKEQYNDLYKKVEALRKEFIS